MIPKTNWRDLIPGDQFEMVIYENNKRIVETFTFVNWPGVSISFQPTSSNGEDIRIVDTKGNYITKYVDDFLWRYWQKEVLSEKAQNPLNSIQHAMAGQIRYVPHVPTINPFSKSQGQLNDLVVEAFKLPSGVKLYGDFKDSQIQENYDGPLRCTCGVTKTMGDDPANKHSLYCDLVTKEKSKL